MCKFSYKLFWIFKKFKIIFMRKVNELKIDNILCTRFLNSSVWYGYANRFARYVKKNHNDYITLILIFKVNALFEHYLPICFVYNPVMLKF